MPGRPSDLRGLLLHVGLTHIRQRGDEIWASCPSHRDSGDSWSINTRTGVHSCFACGHAGTLQTLVMEELEIDNFKANRLIRQYGGEDVLDYLAEAETVSTRMAPEEPESFRPAPLTMRERFATFDDVPDEALAKRKITRDTATEFGLRWKKPKTWVFPIQSLGGRLMGWEEKSPSFVFDRPKGINTSETVFGAPRLRSCEQAILVESPLDACRLWTLGYEHAFASFGAVVSDDQMRLLFQYADEVCLALDNDAAGSENMARLISGVRYGKNGKVYRSTPWWNHKKLVVIAYAKSDGKDVGEMSEDRIAESLAEAEPANLWVQGVTRLNDDIFREAQRVPRGSGRAHVLPARPAGGLRNGARQDRGNHRSGRGTDRRR
jgi:hypothetical protein